MVPLVARHLDSPFVQAVVSENFRSFISLHVSLYNARIPVHAVGGVAYTFRDIFSRVLTEQGHIPGQVIQDPLAGLVRFHQKSDF
jgi:hypothetical protein